MPAERYAIDDHLRGKPPELVALFEHLLTLVQESGPVELEPTRVGVAFHGRRRIFGSAKFGRGGIRGHLVLPRPVTDDPRFTKVEPLTKRLYFHGYLIRANTDLDASFRRHIDEAYQAGQGLRAPPGGEAA
jgi:hypothetical protein